MDQAERTRQELLNNPDLLEQVRNAEPELAASVTSKEEFSQKYHEIQMRQINNERRKLQQRAKLMSDPFNVDAQREIEKIIQEEQVAQNLQQALEYHPEAFGTVTMLYINVEINGHIVKAFVDSGAQATIMRKQCAEHCGVFRLVDTKYQGIASGIGQAAIIGRIHSIPIKMGNSFYACAFTIMDLNVDILLGLDMLKRHQATIDLKANVLVLGEDNRVSFLDESEIPKNQFHHTPPAASSSSKPENKGRTLRDSSSEVVQASASAGQSAAASGPARQTEEEKVKSLTDMGFEESTAKHALEAAQGDLADAVTILMS